MIFKKLWSKNLESCSIEAISELKKGETPKAVIMDDVVKWLASTGKGKKSRKNVNSYVDLNILESVENVAFETVEKAREGKKAR